MSAAIPLPTRALVRALVMLSLMVLVLLAVFSALLPPNQARAAEKKVFGDVTVGPGGTPGDVTTVRGDILVNGRVGGDVESEFGDVKIKAPVGGDVESDFGNVLINDRVGGDVRVKRGEVRAGREANVGGDLYCSDCTMNEFTRSQVAGEMKFGMAPGIGDSPGNSRVLGFIGWFFAALIFVAMSVLAAVLAPRPIESSAGKVGESVGRSLLIGLASVPAAVLLAVVLGVSIVGIPLLLLAAPAYLALVLFGALVAAYFLGRRILFATGRYHGGNALAAAVGASLLAVAYLIPFLGNLIVYALALVGVGGAILALLSRRRTRNYPSYETYVSERRP